MREQLAQLYELQKFDIKIDQANAKLAALTGAKQERRKYAVAKAELDAAEKALRDCELELKDSELELQSIDEKRKAHEKRLYGGSIANPKELAAVEKEIEALKSQQGELDPRVLELYDLVEESRAKADSARQALESAEKAARAAIKSEAAEKVRLETELAEVSAQREKAAASITDRALFSRYEIIRKKTGATVVAKVVEGKCDGCHVGIAQFIMRKLYSSDELQLCESCGRMLLLEK